MPYNIFCGTYLQFRLYSVFYEEVVSQDNSKCKMVQLSKHQLKNIPPKKCNLSMEREQAHAEAQLDRCPKFQRHALDKKAWEERQRCFLPQVSFSPLPSLKKIDFFDEAKKLLWPISDTCNVLCILTISKTVQQNGASARVG